MLARKGTVGGSGRGGFLLVVGPDGRIKLATDDGYGFSEVVTAATTVNDGTWHHVAAVRQGAAFAVYLDGLSVSGTTRGNRSGPLDVRNDLPLTIGATQQEQEPYRFFSGQLDAVTVWNVARSARELVSDMRNAAPSDASVIGCWTFDHRDGADSSLFANAAAPRGPVAYTSPGAPVAGPDVAARLGETGVLTAPPNPAYQLGDGPFTVEAWVRTASAGGSGTVLACKRTVGGSGGAGFLLVLRPDGTVKLATDDGYGFFEGVSVATPVVDGRWHHVAAVRDGRSIQISVDGLPVGTRVGGSAVPPVSVSNDRSLTLGTTEQEQEPYRHFGGDLAAVTLWRTARSPAQVLADMHTLLAGDEDGLIGYWLLAYRDGVDLSPTRNPALPSGTLSWISPGAPIGYYAAESAGQAYLNAPSNPAYQLGTGDFTLEVWARAAEPGGTGTLIARKDAPGGLRDGGFLLVLMPDGRLKLATDSGTGYFQVVTDPTVAGDGAWHFIAAVRRQRELTVFVDGRPVPCQASGNAQPPLSIDSSQPLTFGTTMQTQEPYRFFTGQLGGTALWSGARSADQVAADMGQRLTGREPGLIGLWSFDFRDGRDSSSVRNDAAPVGEVGFPPPGPPIGEVVVAPVLTRVAYDGVAALDAEWAAISPPPVRGYELTAFDAGGTAIATTTTTETHGRLDASAAAGPATVRVRASGPAGPGPWSPAAGIVTGTP